MVVNLITALGLVVLLCEVAYMVIGYFTKNRAGRITFIRSFKNGKCLIIYLLAIPLYCLGRAYKGAGVIVPFNDIVIAFFKAITDAFTLVIMRFNLNDIAKLLADNGFYRAVMYFCYLLVIMNTVLFWLSVASQRFWCFRRLVEGKHTKKDVMYIFGNNVGNVALCNSNKTYYKFIVDKIADSDALPLYASKIPYISDGSFTDCIDQALKGVKKGKRKYVIVINTEDDEQNLKLLNYLCCGIEKFTAEEKQRLFLKLKVFAFGSLNLKAVYEDIVSSANGVIEYVSKHQKIAFDFVDKHPFSLYMNENQIDYSTGLVKQGVNVNVIMIGFGKINRQLMLTSIENNQFITQEEGKIVNKKVNYYVIDKDVNSNNKNLNHDLFRYKKEMQNVNENDYLALPGYPCNDEFIQLDINDIQFYDTIKNIVSNKNDANFIIVSYGEDLENIDLAQKLIEKRQEWQNENTIIFVRAKNWKKEQTQLEQQDCIFFGNESEVVYNFDKLMNNHILNMALLRNRLYDVEKHYYKTGKQITEEELEQLLVETNTKWYSKGTQVERESGLYSCLSIKSKLNFLGLDYAPVTDERPALTEEEFLAVYGKNDMPKYAIKDGEKIVESTIDVKNSTRANFAIHEHLRWNAYVIARGLIPATKQQILTEVDKNGKFTNGKNYALRHHGNITTIDGLIEFRNLIATRDGSDINEVDVIKYDYQILDNVYKLLSDSGYKIVKKQQLL